MYPQVPPVLDVFPSVLLGLKSVFVQRFVEFEKTAFHLRIRRHTVEIGRVSYKVKKICRGAEWRMRSLS